MRALAASLVVSLLIFLAVSGAVLAADDKAAPQPGYLGIEMRDVSKEEAGNLGWDAPTGVWVVKSVTDGPADKAGLTADDVILSIDGVEVDGSEKFRTVIGEKGAGATVRLRVQRQGRMRTVAVRLAERPAEQQAQAQPKAPPSTPVDSPLRLMLDTGGHTAIIRGLLWTPDSRFVLSAGDDKVIRVWDAATGRTVRTIRGEVGRGHEGKIFSLALSPDGKQLMVGGYLGTFTGKRDRTDEDAHKIRVYDFKSGTLQRLLVGHTGVVQSMAFSPDGRRLISGGGLGDLSAIIWDVASGRVLHRLGGHGAETTAVMFTNDGKRAVTGSYDMLVRLWDAETGKLIATMNGHRDKVASLAIHPKDGNIYSGSKDGEIRIWDGRTGKFLRSLANQATTVGAMAFTPDGKRLVSTCGQGHPCNEHVWDVETGKEIASHKIDNDVVITAAMSPDGRRVATGGGSTNEVHIWDPMTGTLFKGTDGRALALVGHGAQNWAVGMAPDNSSIAWGNTWKSGTWEARNPLEFMLRLPSGDHSLGEPQLIVAPKTPAAKTPATKPGGAKEPPAAIAESDYTRAMTRHGQLSLSHRIGGNYGYEAILDVSRNGKVVASLERDASNGYKHTCYSFTPDGRTILSGGSHGVMHAFDLEAVEAAAAKVPDHVLKGSDFDNLAKPFFGHQGDMWALSPSADGRYLVSGSDDQTVRLWNLATREPVVTLYNGRDGEWVLWTEQGYYMGSENADRLVGWQINRGVDKTAEFVEAGQLHRWLYRPDIVAKAITLASAAEAIRTSEGTSFKLEDIIKTPPPRLALLAPAEHATLSGGFARVKLRIDPTPDPVQRIAVRVNGNVITEQTPDTAEGEIEMTVPLASGSNIVTVVATNRIGDSKVEVRVTNSGEGPLDKRGILYVVAIGINAYPNLPKVCGADHKQRCDLSYSVADAGLFADTMARHLGTEHRAIDVRLLTGGPAVTPPPDWKNVTFTQAEPTANNIRDALQRVRNLAEETDTVVVFTAGHGWKDGADYLFLPTDAVPEGRGWRGSTVVKWPELETVVFGAHGRRFLFVDTCHSAGAFNDKLGSAAARNDVTAFVATGPDEQAVEVQDLNQGIFTYAIARGLGPEAKAAAGRGGGVVRASDLERFIKTRTSALIDQYWPNFETATRRKPSPRLYRSQDAADHVLARVD